MERLLAKVATVRVDQSRAAVELWNIRLDLLRRSGSYRALLDHLASPAELAGDNCTCNNACNIGCAALGFDPGLTLRGAGPSAGEPT